MSPFILVFPNWSDLLKAYIHGHYRLNRKTGRRIWIESHQDKRPERGRTTFADWAARRAHFEHHLAHGKQRLALHAFHDLNHADSHQLATELGLAHPDEKGADKGALMEALHGALPARAQALGEALAAQVRADWTQRKAAGKVGRARKEKGPADAVRAINAAWKERSDRRGEHERSVVMYGAKSNERKAALEALKEANKKVEEIEENAKFDRPSTAAGFRKRYGIPADWLITETYTGNKKRPRIAETPGGGCRIVVSVDEAGNHTAVVQVDDYRSMGGKSWKTISKPMPVADAIRQSEARIKPWRDADPARALPSDSNTENTGRAIKAPPTVARTRPKEAIVFARPITGPSGASLVSYEWQWKPEEYIDKRGENRTKRISDWDKSESSQDTGRDIVHHFVVKDPGGELSTVSAESALAMLGYGKSGNDSGIAKKAISAAKSLARLKMSLEAQKGELAELEQQAAVVNALPFPEITVDRDRNQWHMGGSKVQWNEWNRFSDVSSPAGQFPENIPADARKTLEDDFREKEMIRRTGRGMYKLRMLKEEVKDAERRIVRAEKKLSEMTVSVEPAPREGDTKTEDGLKSARPRLLFCFGAVRAGA
jgi:hypothetical protein